VSTATTISINVNIFVFFAPEAICFARLSLCFRPCVRDYIVSAIPPVSIAGFLPNFVIDASWDEDELINFWGQKVIG